MTSMAISNIRSSRRATAFAPATVANVAVGFDILGFALDGVGDEVTVRSDGSTRGVRIEGITGVVPDLPLDPEKNTASVALLALLDDRRLECGFVISIRKGIPLGSGMGGSAASAVAAVVAADGLLGCVLTDQEKLRYSLEGEKAASGAAHPDNAAACLHGGLVAVVSAEPPEVASIPFPAGIVSVLVQGTEWTGFAERLAVDPTPRPYAVAYFLWAALGSLFSVETASRLLLSYAIVGWLVAGSALVRTCSPDKRWRSLLAAPPRSLPGWWWWSLWALPSCPGWRRVRPGCPPNGVPR